MSRSPSFTPVNTNSERVFIALGGNLGDPEKTMAEALANFTRSGESKIVSVSSLYSTPPWGKTNQPDFLNAVAEIRTTLEPRELLTLCLSIEKSFLRERRERWGPRTIDLDIIAYGDRRISEPGLEIPHPQLEKRAFVLVPLSEIADDFKIRGARVKELAMAVDNAGINVRKPSGQWFKG